MQSLRELTGLDPHDLTSEEDLVLVRPHEPWPSLEPLPDGVREHRDGAYLRLSRGALVAGHKAGYLGKISAQVAVFAGCPRFCCSRRFREAVAQLCSRAATLVLVHNFNSLWDLLALFPALDTLYLLHDLAVHQQYLTPSAKDDGLPHALANGESGDCASLSPVRTSLRLLYGDCNALRLNHLFLGTGAAFSLAEQCAKLTELEASIVEQATGASPKLPEFDAEAGALRQWSSLVLGCALPTKEVYVSADIVLEVAKRCPVLRHLQIIAATEAAVYSAGAFQELRSLSALFCSADGSSPKRCRYRAVSAVLSKFSLEALCLRVFSGVSLTGLATSCARLRRLQLVDCELCDLDLPDGAFLQLEELEWRRSAATSATTRSHLYCRRATSMQQPEEAAQHEANLAADAAVQPPMVANRGRGCGCDTTCLAIALGLGCSVVAFVGVVVFFSFYNTPTKEQTRTCGDVMAWGQGYLKAKFKSCLGSAICLGSWCEAEEAITCTSRIPWFDSKCQCCDWCLLRTLACINTDHDRGSFHYCRTICKHL